MPQASSSKNCVECGRSTSGSPRVKDPRGRYYCKPCYEKALRRARETAASSASHPGDDEDRSTSDSMLADVLLNAARDGSSAAGARAGARPAERTARIAPKSCPECDAEADREAVLCVNCGYDFRKKEKVVAPQVIEGEAGDAASAEAPATWPLVIGIVSIVFALLGVAAYGPGVFSAVTTPLQEAGGPLGWTAMVFASLIMLALSVWLGVAAIGLARRRAASVAWLRRWAWAKAGASIAVVSLVFATALINLEVLAAAGMPPELAAMGAAMFAIVLLPTLVWLLFWPVFLLIWLHRESVRAATAQWE